jgi:hypothetical protein
MEGEEKLSGAGFNCPFSDSAPDPGDGGEDRLISPKQNSSILRSSGAATRMEKKWKASAAISCG